jgi:hypothetical protein
MLPTSSSKDLVGKKTRSVLLRINCCSSSRGHPRRVAENKAYWKVFAKHNFEPALVGGVPVMRAPTQAPQPQPASGGDPAGMFGPPMRRGAGSTAVAVLAGLALVGCGGARQDAKEPTGNFPVQVTAASFPGSQRLSEHTAMVLTVRNAGTKSIPNLTVTVCNVTCSYPAPVGEGTSVAPFAQCVGRTPATCVRAQQQGQANLSSPVWVVDRPPGVCSYSCQQGGEGAYATATSNSWQYGKPLPPGAAATFTWGVTAVAAGRFTVAWVIAAGQYGKAKAIVAAGVSPCGRTPCGSFPVTIRQIPAQSYVNAAGQVVQKP